MTALGRPVAWDRWYRPSMVGLSAVLLALAAVRLVTMATTPHGLTMWGADLTQGYLVGAQRFLDTGSPYAPEQVAGPWRLGMFTLIHPPSALVLFVPFLVLPLPLWWAIPLTVTAMAVWRLHPAPWTWPLMALCLVWPRSTGALIFGNTDMWAMAGVAAGAAWGWPIVLLAVKPTFAPLALLAVRSRWAWAAGVICGVAMLPLLPLWIDWIRVVTNAHLGVGYSLLNLPLVVIGAVAWMGRRWGT